MARPVRIMTCRTWRGLVAERDRVRAEVERLRREKREAEIELSILKGALDLVGKERGADPDNLTNREKTILVKAVSAVFV